MRRSRLELDACGIGFVADAAGRADRAILDATLTGLACVRHRGALAADARSSDGAGVLLPITGDLFRRFAAAATTGSGVSVAADDGRLGVAMVFLSGDESSSGDADRTAGRAVLEDACRGEELTVAGWRPVPTDSGELGRYAAASAPAIEQLFVRAGAGVEADEAERRAYRARRHAEAAAREAGFRFYVASFSFRTVVYKGLPPGDRLAAFYPDLGEADFAVPFAIFHQRFSTNTAPSWERAQPFRFLCHNGEINAIAGNENRMWARRLGTEALVGPEELFQPVLDAEDSDSGKLDSTIELLVRGGRDLRHAVAMTIPESWENISDIAAGWRDFYRYHACLLEPWDGPAGVIVTDGRRVAAALDRNGLRPLRYSVCEDGLVVACSEAGAVPTAGHGKVKRGRLGPGQMLCVDPADGGFEDDDAIKETLAGRRPYGRWVEDGLVPVGAGDTIDEYRTDYEARQVVFGYTREETAMILKPMAHDAKEPTFAMGDDTPLPVFGAYRRPVHHSLKQRFAQVTNPPIDHLRERLVMSLRTCLGPRDPLLWERPEAARLVELPSFFVYPSTAELLSDPERAPFRAVVLDATFDVAERGGLRAACERLGAEAEAAVRHGAVLVTVRDNGAAQDRVPVPVLLAVGAVHHALVRAGIRSDASVVVDTDEARDTHHFACLLGYGADAICPRLALESMAAMADAGGVGEEITGALAQERYQAAIEDGVLKIMSKMGISTLDSYRTAQIFEAIGLAEEVVDLCFRGTVTQVGGAGWNMLEDDVRARHAAAQAEDADLARPGIVRFRKGGEYHANNPEMIEALHLDLGLPTEGRSRTRAGRGNGEGDAALTPAVAGPLTGEGIARRALAEERYALYERFAEIVNGRPATEIHDLLEIRPAGPVVPLTEVEPVEAICRRFSTGAMSHGALSREAHETLAAGMNLVGGKANTGEGGEARERYRSRNGRGLDYNSRIKQVASGRFGVTPEYCVFADELQIKMAQGSKPGEGGQIPGHKVSEEIARLRRTQPGVTLISPPPHHDIYSIEDLAQLIFDLKQVNRNADVSVKLVAVAGVGTIAAGVAKGLAESVLISGCTGGTGASPLSSIKHAGLPWELGLAETQQVLVENGLRGRIRLRVDGGFKTGRDVLAGALLGADEYSFGTVAMLAEGCIMVRACHRDTCPTGIATQRPHLRAKFAGSPESVATYFLQMAEEVRRLLASLGLGSLEDAIGRVDLLRQKRTGDPRLDCLDLSTLLADPGQGERRFTARVDVQSARSSLGDRLVEDSFRAIWEGDDLELRYPITNSDRTVGAALGGAIALEFGEASPPGQVTAYFSGSAGQSFGAFLTKGIDLRLVGEANDYVGKGMAGGCIVIRPPEDDAGDPHLMGNTALYGATGGELFCAGAAGERFCVRNSGATTVVEGVGEHACEYMTGGTVVVIGPMRENLGAGMTGGEAFVHSPEAPHAQVNTSLVTVVRPDGADLERVRDLVERHAVLTGSPRAAALLARWAETAEEIWQILPLTEVGRIESTQKEALGSS